MKKVLILFIVFFCIPTIFSQTPLNKGTYSIGGSISFTSKSGDRGVITENEFIFNPQFGYFLFDNILTSIAVSYSHFKTEYQHGNQWTERYGIGPSVRYYFDTQVVKPFIGISYLYGKEETDTWSDNFYSDEVKLTRLAEKI